MIDIITIPFIVSLLVATMRIMPPLVMASTGEMVSENAGMLNIGIEGIMSIGAITGFAVGNFTGNAYMGMLGGLVAGLIFNMIYAYTTIHLNADQIIIGTAMNIIGIALSSYIYTTLFSKATNIQIPQAETISIPLLEKIPIIGEVLFQQSLLGYIAILIVILVYIFLYKTRIGLSLRAVGEYPKAAETLGISVIQKKYLACCICGALSGIGGAYLTTTYVRSFMEGIVSGRGYIALAAVIFGKWKPKGVYFACFLFALLDALQMRLQSVNANIPYQLLIMMPYVITLLTLTFFMKTGTGPKTSGKPYVRES